MGLLNNLTIIVTLLSSASVFAGSLNFDGRFDWDNITYSSDHASAASSGKSDFLMQTGRLDYKGKYNEDLSFRLRIRFNRNDHTVRNDNLSNEIDYAYVAHRICNDVTLTLGRFNSDLGGYDAMQPSADVYLKTRNYALIHDGTTYTGRRAYVSGAKVTALLSNYEVNIFAADNKEGSDVPSQTRLMSGIVARANFLENTLSAWASFAQENTNGGTGSLASDSDARYNFTTVGLKYELPEWFAAFDYSSNTAGKLTISSVQNDYGMTAAVLNAGYNLDRYTFKLVYEVSEAKLSPVSGVQGKTTTTGVGAVAEYKPSNDKNFRYHLAYTNRTDTADPGSTTPTESHVIAGVRLYADFLK